VKNTNDTSVPVQVGFYGAIVVFLSENHNIGMVSQVESVCILAHIVCCIINLQSLVLVDTVIFNMQRIMLMIFVLIFVS
jgi:hypothetical protein